MNEFVTTSESRTVTAHEIFNTNPLQQDEDGKLVARVYENLFDRPKRGAAEAGGEHKKRRDTVHTEQERESKPRP